ncbi:MAG: type II secretion system protein [Patescibacteria group bacterium]
MRNSQGFSVVEIVVAAAIIVTLVTAAAGAWQLYLRVSNTGTQQSQAAIMMEEAVEALRLLRDQSWTSNIAPLTLETTYQLYWDGSQYQTTTTQILLQNQFVRSLIFSAVNRDSNDNVASSGTNDPDTRKVTISVFNVGATSTPIIQSEMLIHNVYAN